MDENVRRSYDRVVEDYAARFCDELDKKPFDRKMLDWLAEKVSDQQVICDMGCGPGQIARYLFDHGATVCGLDLSPGMVERAQKLNPDITFHQGDMLSLANVTNNSYGGVAAFYSIIHVPRPRLNQALGGVKASVTPGRDIVAHVSYWARDHSPR